jgi:SAM-dependent methyltransferase
VGLSRRIYRLIKRGYLAGKYGYDLSGQPPLARELGKLLYLFPLRRSQVDREVRFLQAVPEGRLLDVGFGSGQWLLSMRKRGWQVDGVDFDQQAVQAATKLGLAVRCGSLEQQNFPKQTFDAVTMSHVIEHLPDPVRTLQECARILKPGGRLILWTPNTSSLGHRLLKRHWLGLESPRHLYLFSPPSMRTLLEQGGFTRISIRTRNSLYFWQQSFMLWTRKRGMPPRIGGKLAASFVPSMLTLLEAVLLVASARSGEWLDVRASSG